MFDDTLDRDIPYRSTHAPLQSALQRSYAPFSDFSTFYPAQDLRNAPEGIAVYGLCVTQNAERRFPDVIVSATGAFIERLGKVDYRRLKSFRQPGGIALIKQFGIDRDLEFKEAPIALHPYGTSLRCHWIFSS